MNDPISSVPAHPANADTTIAKDMDWDHPFHLHGFFFHPTIP